MASNIAAPPGSIITDRRPVSAAAVANYAPRPKCPPGSVAFDNRGKWQCRELVAPDGGPYSHGVVVSPVVPGVPSSPSGPGPQIHPTQVTPMARSFGVLGKVGGVLNAPWASGMTAGGAPPITFNPAPPTSPFFGQTTTQTIGQSLGNAGCDRLPSYLQSACRAAVGTFTNGSQQVPGGGNQTVPGQVDPTPGTVTPAEASTGATGLQLPYKELRETTVCPDYRGKSGRMARGIVHVNPMTGMEVCLPRGVSGSPFGLVRKWAKQPKAYISRGDIKTLKAAERTRKKVKSVAKLTGQTCKTRGR